MPEHSMSLPASGQNQQLHAQVPPGHTVKYSAKPDPRFRRGECLTAWVDSGVFFEFTPAEARLAAMLAIRAEPSQDADYYTTPKISPAEFEQVASMKTSIFYIAFNRLKERGLITESRRVSKLLLLFESQQACARYLADPQTHFDFPSTYVESDVSDGQKAPAPVENSTGARADDSTYVDNSTGAGAEKSTYVESDVSEGQKAPAPVENSTGAGAFVSSPIRNAHARPSVRTDRRSVKTPSPSVSPNDGAQGAGRMDRGLQPGGEEPDWYHIQFADITDPIRRLFLLKQAISAGIVRDCDDHHLRFFEAAIHALMYKPKPWKKPIDEEGRVGLFVDFVQHIGLPAEQFAKKWRCVKKPERDRAAAEFKQLRDGPPGPRAADADADPPLTRRRTLSHMAVAARDMVAAIAIERGCDPRGKFAVDLAKSRLKLAEAAYLALLDEVDEHTSWGSRASPPHTEPAEHERPAGHGTERRVDREGSRDARS